MIIYSLDILKDVTLPTKVCLVKTIVFTVVMYGCENWTIKQAEHQRIWTVVLEKALESPLDCKEIQPVNPKGSQSWIFIVRTDVEAEAPKLQPPDAKNWPTGKDPNARKDFRQEEKGTTEDRMVGWHHQLDEHKFEQAPGVGDGQGSLACFSLWGHKEWDMTSNWTELIIFMNSDTVNQPWVSFNSLYLSRNLSILSKLYDLWVYNCSSIPLQLLLFSV